MGRSAAGLPSFPVPPVRSSARLPSTVSMLSQHWMYYDGVALVVEETTSGMYYLIEDLKQREWRRGWPKRSIGILMSFTRNSFESLCIVGQK